MSYHTCIGAKTRSKQGDEAHWEDIVARFGTRKAVEVRRAPYAPLCSVRLAPKVQQYAAVVR